MLPLPACLAALAALLAASPEAPLPVTVAPRAARPGDAVLVRVPAGAEPAPPRATLAGRPLAFWREGAEWRALGALPIETPVGAATAAVTLADGATATAELEIVEPGFLAHALTLPPKYVEPPAEVRARIEADKKAFAAAYDRPFEPPRFTGPFDWPRRARTSGRFGDQRTLNGKKESVHYGLDVTGPRGAPVAAANDGIVAIARDAYMSGRTVVLAHGAGVFTVYMHLDRIEVKDGQAVKKGQRIGRLGSTGRSTGPHLHWGAKVDGLLVDPESLLALDPVAGTARARTAAARPAPTAAAPTP